MKSVIVNVQIQFDIPENGDVMQHTYDGIDFLNKELQSVAHPLAAQILTSGISPTDVEVQDWDEEE